MSKKKNEEMGIAEKMVLKAIDNNEMEKLLIGDEEYKVPVPPMEPIYNPTDWIQITREISLLHEKKPELKVNIMYEKTLLNMINEKTLSLYAVANTIFNQLMDENKGKASFAINKDKLLPLLKDKLQKNKHRLENEFVWMGMGRPDGVWGAINAINCVLNEKTGISML
jgi:hypothetical protein